MGVVGQVIPKKEAGGKVTGAAKHSDDYVVPDMLYTRMVTSSSANARIVSADSLEALAAQGVLNF